MGERGGIGIVPLQETVQADLKAALGLTAKPVLCRHVLWKRALPLLSPQYGRVEAAWVALEQAAPQLVLTGAHVGGASLAEVIEHAHVAADRTVEVLLDHASRRLYARAAAAAKAKAAAEAAEAMAVAVAREKELKRVVAMFPDLDAAQRLQMADRVARQRLTPPTVEAPPAAAAAADADADAALQLFSGGAGSDDPDDNVRSALLAAAAKPPPPPSPPSSSSSSAEKRRPGRWSRRGKASPAAEETQFTPLDAPEPPRSESLVSTVAPSMMEDVPAQAAPAEEGWGWRMDGINDVRAAAAAARAAAAAKRLRPLTREERKERDRLAREEVEKQLKAEKQMASKERLTAEKERRVERERLGKDKKLTDSPRKAPPPPPASPPPQPPASPASDERDEVRGSAPPASARDQRRSRRGASPKSRRAAEAANDVAAVEVKARTLVADGGGLGKSPKDKKPSWG